MRLFKRIMRLGVVIVMGVVIVFVFSQLNTQNDSTVQLPQLSQSSPTPFYEFTIPFLQERQYHSQLEQKESLATNNEYTSYLASYDSDGLQINGLLTVPVTEPPPGGWPAIVFIHGYIPPQQYETTSRYEDYVDYLASAGFVVFKIDLRGHGDSEGIPGGAYFSSDYVIDTLNARAALINSGFVNENRIGLWGHSMAGNVVMRSIVVKPDIPAAVIWAGAVYTYDDMRELGISDSSYQRPEDDSQRSQERSRLFEVHDRNDASDIFWEQMAPTNYLDSVQTAIQIHHATNDPVVSIEYSRNLMSILDETALPHQLYEYPTGGHNLTGSSFNQAMQRTVEWYQEYL